MVPTAGGGPTPLTAEETIHELEPYCSGFLCTYVDKEGMLQGTDLAWFRRLRSGTAMEITAAGGITTIEDIQELDALGIHAAVGMAIYTGRLNLDTLAAFNRNANLRPARQGGQRKSSDSISV